MGTRERRQKRSGPAVDEGSTTLWYESMAQGPWRLGVLFYRYRADHLAEAHFEASYSAKGLIIYQPGCSGEERTFFAWADIDRIEPMAGFFASIERADGSCYRLKQQHGGWRSSKAAERLATLDDLLRRYKDRPRP